MNITFKALPSMILLVSTAQFAQAHSDFKVQTLSSTDTAVATSNAIQISHGCDAVGKTPKDVIALSIVFPVAANMQDFKENVVVSKVVGTTVVVDNAYNPSEDFDFGSTPTPTITAVTAGNIFPNTRPIAINGKTVGFQSWLGKPYAGGSPVLETVTDESGTFIETTGSGIFELSKIDFKPTSCVTKLRIFAASVNWCESGKKSFTSWTRLDAWIQSADTVFGSKSDITDVGAPPKLTINRDLTKSPIKEGTNCEGKADTIILQPSSELINNYLPIKSAKWPVGTSGQLFWPTIK
jgi:hypothetical protein